MRRWLLRLLLERVAAARPPDKTIKERYLRRWHIFRSRPASVYLHHFSESDDDRALHDHPWWNISIILEGEYWEHMQRYTILRPVGSVLIRTRATHAHRIELSSPSAWTLFLTGPRTRSWGFLCPGGWKDHREFDRDGGC